MIRIAFIGVLLLAGALAFGAFSLARGGGSSAPSTTQSPPVDAEPVVVEETALPEDQRFYFLADQDLSQGPLALILYSVGANGADVVVTDPDALRAAQDVVYVTTDMTGATETPRFAALFLGEDLMLDVPCAPDPCTDDGSLASLRDASQPLIEVQEIHDSYESYLNAVTFINETPGFAFLDLRAASDPPHPVARQVPTATIALPTIYRPADQPLDVQTHLALLRALVEGALPEGVTLEDFSIRQHDPAIVVDADNRSPATRGGAEIPFPDVEFYTPEFDITGAATLSEDTLEQLTEDTLLRVDWDDAARAFILSVGFQCADCYDVQISGAAFNRATVIDSIAERYTLDFYDLRDTP